MDYKTNAIVEDDVNYYLDNCINRVFAILGIYEDCQKNNNFDAFHTYLNRFIIEFIGINDLFNKEVFISLIGILNGMNVSQNLTHKDVKSLVFHCISIIKRGVK